MEVSGQLHAPAALLPRKSPWYPLDMRLGGPQSRSGRGGEEKNSQTLEYPIIQLYVTELSRLFFLRLRLRYFLPHLKYFFLVSMTLCY
jgi:hypothetical protein